MYQFLIKCFQWIVAVLQPCMNLAIVLGQLANFFSCFATTHRRFPPHLLRRCLLPSLCLCPLSPLPFLPLPTPLLLVLAPAACTLTLPAPSPPCSACPLTPTSSPCSACTLALPCSASPSFCSPHRYTCPIACLKYLLSPTNCFKLHYIGI